MTQKRRRPDTPRRSVPIGRGPSPNGTGARHDAAPDDELREMFAALEAAGGSTTSPRRATPASTGPPPPTRRLVKLAHPPGLTPAEAEARLRVRGLLHNAGVLEDFSAPSFGAVEDLTATDGRPRGVSLPTVQRGELGDAEALLMAQAATLNAIFARCATAASRNLEGLYLDATDRYLRLALRAQRASK